MRFYIYPNSGTYCEVLREIGHSKEFWKLTFRSSIGPFSFAPIYSMVKFVPFEDLWHYRCFYYYYYYYYYYYCSFDLNFFYVLVWAALPLSYCIFLFQEWTNKDYYCNYTNKPDNIQRFVFRVQTSTFISK